MEDGPTPVEKPVDPETIKAQQAYTQLILDSAKEHQELVKKGLIAE